MRARCRAHRHSFVEVDIHGQPSGAWVCTDHACLFGHGPGQRCAFSWEAHDLEGELFITC